MSRLTSKQIIEHLAGGEQPFVGLDIAVNRKKGLRFVSRVESGICELTLRFKPHIRLAREWPYLDLPLPASGAMSQEDAVDVFRLSNDEASVVAHSFGKASFVAVDAPCSLAEGDERRASELAWHRLEILSAKDEKPLKRKNRGVLWSPTREEIVESLDRYFDPVENRKPTTQQLTTLSQALWIFVGLWVYRVLEQAETPAIEVYPHASRVICQEIAEQEGKAQLQDCFRVWSTAFSFDDFIKKKSETNDAAIGSFTAFLHHRGLTQELAPGEIVIPERPEAGMNWQPA